MIKIMSAKIHIGEERDSRYLYKGGLNGPIPQIPHARERTQSTGMLVPRLFAVLIDRGYQRTPPIHIQRKTTTDEPTADRSRALA